MQFPTILLDPPWMYLTRSAKGRGRSPKYDLMTNDRILNMPIQSVMSPHCAVLMWVTSPFLEVGLQCFRQWGLTYKGWGFVWAKTNPKAVDRFTMILDDANWFMSTGYYTRKNTELCLLGIKGKRRRKSASVRELIVAPRGKHSAKPLIQYDRIEQLFGGGYLELFARESRAGWVSLGNEIDGLDIYSSLYRVANDLSLDNGLKSTLNAA